MHIDWLECTIHQKEIRVTVGKDHKPIDGKEYRSVRDILSELQNYFGDSWEVLDYGQMFYDRSAIVWGSGRVLWSTSRPEMGVHVRLPASSFEIGVDAEKVLRDLYNLGGKFSRIDLALDDFDGCLSMQTIRDYVLSKQFTCRGTRVKENANLHGGCGHTIYFGSRTSETFCRIYDKSAEQLELHKGVYTHWIRVEFEFKHDRADAVAREIVFGDDWRDVARGWFLSYLDFKTESSDANKSRWLSVSWWVDFLGVAVKVRLLVFKVKRSVERIRTWVKRSVVPSLYVLGQTVGYDVLFQDVVEAKERLSKNQESLIASYVDMLAKSGVA